MERDDSSDVLHPRVSESSADFSCAVPFVSSDFEVSHTRIWIFLCVVTVVQSRPTCFSQAGSDITRIFVQ